jgi:hypothetical protein
MSVTAFILTTTVLRGAGECIRYSSSEANRFLASQEITHILWNPKVHYRIHKRHPPGPILRQLDLVHTSNPSTWRSILILSTHLILGLPSGLFPSGFPYQNHVHTSPLPHQTIYKHGDNAGVTLTFRHTSNYKQNTARCCKQWQFSFSAVSCHQMNLCRRPPPPHTHKRCASYTVFH